MAEQRKDEGKRREHVTSHHGASVRTALHHKDEDNLLTQSYKSILQAVKKPPSRTTWLVLVAVLLAAALVGSWFWFTSSATASSSAVWLQKMETPRTAADLEKFAQNSDHQGTVAGRFALAEAARRQMQAVANLGDVTQRANALADIGKARDTYEKLVKESGDTPALMQESLMGAAKANETLGDLGKAKQFYQQLAKDYGNTALGREADARLKALDDENAKKVMETLKDEFAPSR